MTQRTTTEPTASTLDDAIEATRTASPCPCGTDPYTWIINDPLDGRVICFGCGTCGAAWTRVAPEPMQRAYARTLARKQNGRVR